MSTGVNTSTEFKKVTIPLSKTVKTDELIRPILFAEGNVRQFHDGDFTIENRELINIVYEECILVLFYLDNEESKELVKIWSNASSQVAGAQFGAVHLGLEKRIAKNFNSLNMDSNHPYHWARLQQVPFIMVYRKGWPVAFYNGHRATQPIIDYALTLACRGDYREEKHIFSSMTVNQNLEMPGANRYSVKKNSGTVLPLRTESTEFVVSRPIRGFDSSAPVKAVEDSEIDERFVDKKTTNTNLAPPVVP